MEFKDDLTSMARAYEENYESKNKLNKRLRGLASDAIEESLDNIEEDCAKNYITYADKDESKIIERITKKIQTWLMKEKDKIDEKYLNLPQVIYNLVYDIIRDEKAMKKLTCSLIKEQLAFTVRDSFTDTDSEVYSLIRFYVFQEFTKFSNLFQQIIKDIELTMNKMQIVERLINVEKLTTLTHNKLNALTKKAE